MEYLGLSMHILQPPLPAGPVEGEYGELEVGTTDWKRGKPTLWCGKAKFVWIDMRQSGRRGGEGMGGGEPGEGVGEREGLITRERREEEGWENWWPGMRRWNLGLWCPEAVLELGEAEVLGQRER